MVVAALAAKFQSPIKRVWSSHEGDTFVEIPFPESFNPLLSGSGLHTMNLNHLELP